MRIGLQIPNFTYPGAPELRATLKDIVQTADSAGFYSLWVMDHFFQISFVGPAHLDMLEGYTTLGYFAGLTQKVKLGTLVTGVIYRYPGILIKTATTLDVLSGGRVYLGIGAGWFEQEAKGLGVPFPSLKERFELLEEALQVAHQMWSPENNGPYQGKHLQLAETLCVPAPISQPHPPIMIGGQGEKKTLKLVAQYGDACNLFIQLGKDTLRQKLDILKQHCEALGRPYEQIEKTALGSVMPGTSPADTIKELTELAQLGFQHVIYSFPDVYEIKRLETFARTVIPAVAEL
ncbi:MAG: LLM class F420-dependent oxidoreductase [Chloroflexi bacterium]|nr:LLM class F420-dependent oxidoreductase [Chloroflexota bacterium]